MKKNKAFTLIELLAVIIILAAIALIIAPLVLDIIREQQKKTFKESINGILRSSRLEIVNSGLSFPVTFTYSDGKLLSPTGKELKVTGKIPEGSGSVRYNSEDDIDLAIHDNSWCGTYSKTSKEVNVNELNGECILPLVYTPNECFEVEEMENIEYTVNQTECIAYFTSDDFSMSPEEVTTYCNGGEVSGYTLDYDIQFGYVDASELEQAGAITITSKTVDGVIITGYLRDNGKCTGDVVIPEAIDGVTVKEIGKSSFSNKDMTSVVLPSGIITIGPEAFLSGMLGFYDNKEQHNAQLLKTDNKYNSKFLDSRDVRGNNHIQFVDFSRATKLENIADYAFQGNQLTNITIPKSVMSIGSGAFAYNWLTSVVIPNGVTSISWYAFTYNKLTNVTIPDSLTEIDVHAFSHNQLTSVIIPNGIVNIEELAFYDNKLTSVIIPESVTSIGNKAFWNNQLTSVTIPKSVTSIGKLAFNNNQLPDSEAFIYARKSDGSVDTTTLISYGGAKRDNVVVPTGVTHIEEDAFSYNQLTSVIIPEGVTSIGDSAFYSNQLTSVIIPEGVTSIGDSAFYSNQLTSVIIPNSVTSIGELAFYNNRLTSVTIKGKSSKSDFKSYPKWSNPFGWAEGYSDSNIIWNG